MIKASIIGATGYVGLELIRLLASHPDIELASLASQSYAGRRIEAVYPSLRGCVSKEICAPDAGAIGKNSDVVFTALPHGASGEVMPLLASAGCRIIDMSGDFRYDDPQVYEKWYGQPQPAPEIANQFVFGLPELHRKKIKKTRHVANPGCYTTASILALAPLLKAGLIQPDSITIDAKSGVSGAGRKPSQANHFPETDGNFKAYNPIAHRHTSEIEQELSHAAGQPIQLGFTPHLLPVKRGILATCYARLADRPDEAAFQKAYADMYADEAFITVNPHGDLPELKHVVGSNFVRIGYILDERLSRVLVVSCIDNLIKGAAGQAVQNMNLLFGLPEGTGLMSPAWYL